LPTAGEQTALPRRSEFRAREKPRSDVAVSGLIHGRVRVWSEDGRILATGGSNLLHVARRR
jgi:hypothetical protein